MSGLHVGALYSQETVLHFLNVEKESVNSSIYLVIIQEKKRNIWKVEICPDRELGKRKLTKYGWERQLSKLKNKQAEQLLWQRTPDWTWQREGPTGATGKLQGSPQGDTVSKGHYVRTVKKPHASDWKLLD